MRLPGGAGRTADARRRRPRHRLGRGIKNLMYTEGFDDYSTARVRLADGVATLKFATAEVGQGFVTLAAADRPHGARRRRRGARPHRHPDRLGRLDVGVAPDVDERRRGRRARAALVRERLFEHVAAQHGLDPLRLADRRHRRRRHDGRVADAGGRGDRRGRVRRDASSTTTRPPRISTSTARATATPRSRSSPTVRWSTSTPSSVW